MATTIQQAIIVYTIFNTLVASAARKGKGSIYVSGHHTVCCTSLTIPSHQTRKTKYKPTDPRYINTHPATNETIAASIIISIYPSRSTCMYDSIVAGQRTRLLVGRDEGHPGGKLSRRNSPRPEGIVVADRIHKT